MLNDNPRHMCDGYGSRSVCMSVCMSVCLSATTYLVYTTKMRRHRVSYLGLNHNAAQG